MRVLIVTNMFPTPADPAWGSFVKEQIDDLRSLGLDVDQVAFHGHEKRTEYARAIATVRRALQAGSYDVVHAHYGLSGAVATLARPRVPLVTTFHGSDYDGPAWQRWVSTAVARRSSVIVVSESGRRRLGAPAAALIPMGVNTRLFTPVDRVEARRRLGWEEEGPYALLAGARRDPVKGAPLFDAAVAQVPALKGVTLEGLTREGAALALNAADVLVVASVREGSPLTVRESLACETPVVAVPVGDVPAVLAGLPGCAVVPRDPAALAEAISTALEAGRDPSLRERAEETSRDVVAHRVAVVYEEILR